MGGRLGAASPLRGPMVRWRAGAFRRPGGRIFRKELVPMDAQTVIALCEVLLVVIGIIGLVTGRRE